MFFGGKLLQLGMRFMKQLPLREKRFFKRFKTSYSSL